MDKGTLRIHQIELMVKSSPSLSDCSCIRQHANSPLKNYQPPTVIPGGDMAKV